MKYSVCFLVITLLVTSCNTIEEASIASNQTFIKFFHGLNNFSATDIKSTTQGYVLLGNTVTSAGAYTTIIISTDSKGTQLGETRYIPGVRSKAFQILSSGEYIILGDSIKRNENTDNVANIEIYSMQILKVSAEGAIIKKQEFKDTNTNPSIASVDYISSSLQLTDDEKVIALGLYKQDLSSSEKPFIAVMNNDLQVSWFKQYDLQDRNYVNGKSVYYHDGSILWASSILKPAFNESYLAIPIVEENSTFKNFSLQGETTSQFYVASDIHPAYVESMGYAVIGTRSQTDGANANIYFIRVNREGNFIQGSEKLYDGLLSLENKSVAPDESANQDNGKAITSTHDGGYVLVGTTQSGTSARDIYVSKIDAVGNIVWSKVYGGDGDEDVAAVIEEDDGGIVICGTNTLSGLSALMLLKIDINGELKN